MLRRTLRRLRNHRFLANVALDVVTAIGFLHLLLFFAGEIIDVWQKVKRL